MELLLSIGFSITGFTIFLLQGKKENKTIHKFAIALLLLWFIRFVLFYLKIEVDLTHVPWLFFIDQNLFFLDGIFLFWFSKSLNNEKFSLIKESIHLVPFAIAMALTASLFISYSGTQLNEIYQEAKSIIASQSFTPSLEEIIFIIAILLQNVIYLFLGYKKIKQYNQNIRSSYSTIDRIQVNWLPKLFKIWMILLVAPLIIFFINYINPIIDLNVIEPFLIASLVVAAIYFSVHIINQYYASFLFDKKTSKTNVQEIDNDKLKSAYIELQELMALKKPYLDDDLTLGKLSEQMDMKPTKLSNVIKTQTSGNFYDYINAFRIEAVKKELITTNEQIILIAYNNGFSSKSTFNKVFKYTTGDSPSQFRKKFTAQNKSR